jgi:hypothetical protein
MTLVRAPLLAFAVAALAAGCMNFMPPPQSGGTTDPAAGGTPGAGEPGEPGAAAGEPTSFGAANETGNKPADKPPTPTTVEVRSECSKTVPVFYGEKPKFGSGKKSSVSGNSTSSEGRKADGTLTVWIIDDSENGIASAKVTPETKRVVIDRSCTSIRAE